MTFMISVALMFSMTLILSIVLLVMRFFENLLVFWAQVFLLLMPAMVLALVLTMVLSLMGVFLLRYDLISTRAFFGPLTGASHRRHCAVIVSSRCMTSRDRRFKGRTPRQRVLQCCDKRSRDGALVEPMASLRVSSR